MGKDIKRTKAYKKLKSAMIANLEARGLVEDMYKDKVQEYMDLWERMQVLKEDIKERGVTVMDTKRGMEVENRSVSLELQTSRQMLSIFAALGFRDEAINSRMQSETEDEL